jgi:hypothetical protein
MTSKARPPSLQRGYANAVAKYRATPRGHRGP